MQRESNKNNQEEGMNDVWEKYLELLETQYYYRGLDNALVSEGCAIGFKQAGGAANDAAYKVGGACYVK